MQGAVSCTRPGWLAGAGWLLAHTAPLRSTWRSYRDFATEAPWRVRHPTASKTLHHRHSLSRHKTVTAAVPSSDLNESPDVQLQRPPRLVLATLPQTSLT